MRDIEIDRGRRADQRYSQALQAGSGLAQAAAPSLLGAGTAAAQRQQREGERRDVRLRQAIQSGSTLAQGAASTLLGAGQTSLQQQEFVTRAALDNLNQNRQWNQFLAQHGLDRERLMFEMEQGNIEVILPIIQQFIQASGIAAGGFF
jgi:reverse gyrase